MKFSFATFTILFTVTKLTGPLKMNGSVVMKNRPRIPTPDVTKEVVDRENRLAQMHLNNNHPGSQNSSTGSISPNSLANALVAHNPVPYSDQMPVAVQVRSFVLRYFSNIFSRKCSCSSVTWRVSKLLFIEFHLKTKNIELRGTLLNCFTVKEHF